MRLAKDSKPDFPEEDMLQTFEHSIVTHVQSMCSWLRIDEEEFPVRLHVKQMFSHLADILMERNQEKGND